MPGRVPGSGGPAAHHRSGPSRATRCAGQSICGGIRRQRLASAGPSPGFAEQVQGAVRSDHPQRDGGRAERRQRVVQDGGGDLPAVGGQIHGRPRELVPQRPGTCHVARRAKDRGKGRVKDRDKGGRRDRGRGAADDRGGNLRHRSPRLAGERGQLACSLGGRTAQPLDEGTPGHVDDRPGRRAGAHLVQLAPLPVDHRRQAQDLLAAARHRSPTFLMPQPAAGAGAVRRDPPLAYAPTRAGPRFRRLPLARAFPPPQAMRAWMAMHARSPRSRHH